MTNKHIIFLIRLVNQCLHAHRPGDQYLEHQPSGFFFFFFMCNIFESKYFIIYSDTLYMQSLFHKMYLTEKKDELHPIHLPSHYFADTTHSIERVHNSTIQLMEYFPYLNHTLLFNFSSALHQTQAYLA